MGFFDNDDEEKYMDFNIPNTEQEIYKSIIDVFLDGNIVDYIMSNTFNHFNTYVVKIFKLNLPSILRPDIYVIDSSNFMSYEAYIEIKTSSSKLRIVVKYDYYTTVSEFIYKGYEIISSEDNANEIVGKYFPSITTKSAMK